MIQKYLQMTTNKPTIACAGHSCPAKLYCKLHQNWTKKDQMTELIRPPFIKFKDGHMECDDLVVLPQTNNNGNRQRKAI